MNNEINKEYSFDYDENAAIDDDELDSNLSGENGKRERLRNIPDINLYKLLSKKRKCIHFCFKKIIVLSFIPTLIYNLFWIIILKRITFDNLVNFNFNEFRTCILTACYTVLAKGIFILFVPQIMCGQENRINDFSYICVLLKTLTSFLYSKYIINNMNNKFISEDNYNSNNKIYYWINLYYKFECTYIKGIYSIIATILLVVLIVIIKEIYKTNRYVL